MFVVSSSSWHIPESSGLRLRRAGPFEPKHEHELGKALHLVEFPDPQNPA